MSSKNFNSFKDFQSDQIQTSSCKLFTAHYACSNSDLNLTLVTGTTNGFIFRIISSLIESWGVRLTCFDCKALNCSLNLNSQLFVTQFPEIPSYSFLPKLHDLELLGIPRIILNKCL